MSSFKRNIKEKYTEQVQPEFTEQAWTQFLDYEEAKESGKKKGLWFVPLAIAVGLVIVLIMKNCSGDGHDQVSILSDKIEVATEESEEKEIIVENNDPEVKENVSEASKNSLDLASNTILEDDSVSDSSISIGVVKKPIENYTPSYDRVDENPSVDNTSFYDTRNDLESERKESPSILKEEIDDITESRVVAYALPLSVSGFKSFPIPERLIASQPLTLYLSENETSRLSHYAMDLALLSIPVNHRSIANQGWLGGLIHGSYQINDTWSMDAELDVSRLSFTSQVLNRNLGLRSVNYPDRQASFQDVNRTSWLIGSSLGIRYKLLSIGNLELLTRTGLGYQKEVSRLLDYSFTGSADLPVIQSSDEPLETSQFFWRIGMSTRWRIGKGTYIHSGLERQFLINDSSTILSPSFRITAGIGKKF